VRQASHVAIGTPEGSEQELEERAVPFHALYKHWERTRWSLDTLRYEIDRASFEALDENTRERMRWLFTHRFDGESTVVRLMTPFVSAAPDLDLRLLMATQLVDEVRHMKAIVRIYEEVFGVAGGLPAVQALADARRDPMTERLYATLESWIDALTTDPTPDAYLRAVVAYHLIGEGVVARVSTTLSTPVFERLGDFPGILMGQRLVSRDESRHIGIGVTYVRQEMTRNRARTLRLVDEVVQHSVARFVEVLGMATDGLAQAVAEHYGATPQEYFMEASRLIGVRLRSIGADALVAPGSWPPAR
jgi:ribonucleotide reductase beta subunit family protein with ferritin-like domain